MKSTKGGLKGEAFHFTVHDIHNTFEYEIIGEMGGFGRGLAGCQIYQLLLLQRKNYYL